MRILPALVAASLLLSASSVARGEDRGGGGKNKGEE